MQVFNAINCRKIGMREFNVFESFFHNFYFLAILSVIVLVQIIIIQIFPTWLRASNMEKSEWGACIIVGSTTLLISFLLKLTPEGLLKRMPVPKFFNED